MFESLLSGESTMKTISNRTAFVVIVSFAALCGVFVFSASKWPRTSHWKQYQRQYPEKAIRANLRKINFAAKDYMRSHRVDKAPYPDMVGKSLFLNKPIEPILGEDYNTICVTGQDTRIEVVTKDGRTIFITFDPLGTFTAGPAMMPMPPRTKPSR